MPVCKQCNQFSNCLTVDTCEHCGAKDWIDPPKISGPESVPLAERATVAVISYFGKLVLAFAIVTGIYYEGEWLTAKDGFHIEKIEKQVLTARHDKLRYTAEQAPDTNSDPFLKTLNDDGLPDLIIGPVGKSVPDFTESTEPVTMEMRDGKLSPEDRAILLKMSRLTAQRSAKSERTGAEGRSVNTK